MAAVIFIICALLCGAYYLAIIIHAGLGTTFAGFWLLAAFGFAALGALFYADKHIHIIAKIPKAVIIAVCVAVMAGALLFIFLFVNVLSRMLSKPDNKADYLVVLGAQIRGERITKSLKKRLDAAAEYYDENKNVVIIVSGGQGEGEDTTEAAAMRKYLIEEKGVPPENIIEEEKATTTNENLKFSYEIICSRGDENANVLICSNNFHIARALKLARHIGMEDAEGLAAGSDNVLLLNYMVRDSLAIFKEFLLGNLSLIG